MSSSFLENYDLAEPAIRKLYDSKLRLAILDALSKGPMRLADLRREIDANAPNTSTKAKDLEDMGVIERTDDGYALTPYGAAIRAWSSEAFEFFGTYSKFKEFWDTHMTSGIPEFLWKRIGELSNSVLITTKGGDVNAVNEAFMGMLSSIKKTFYGVTPIYHKDWWDLSVALARRGVDTRIISTEEVARMIAKNATKDDLHFMDTCKNVEWSVVPNEISVAFTVSEAFLSLGLMNRSGVYTLDADLDSTDPRAVRWGMDLFDYYHKQSKSITLSDYL